MSVQEFKLGVFLNTSKNVTYLDNFEDFLLLVSRVNIRAGEPVSGVFGSLEFEPLEK